MLFRSGLSLAYATADYLASKIAAKTLFATHYFELTELAEQQQGLVNVHLMGWDGIDRFDYSPYLKAPKRIYEGIRTRFNLLRTAKIGSTIT